MGFKKLPYYLGKSQFACICDNRQDLDGEIYKSKKIMDESNDCSINVTDVTCINNIMGKDIDLKDVNLKNQCPNFNLSDNLQDEMKKYLDGDSNGKTKEYIAIILLIFIILIIIIVIIVSLAKGVSKKNKERKLQELIQQGEL